MKKSVVAKYGGTSVAHIAKALAVIAANPHQKIIVVSAPGKQKPADVKVTDLLLKYAHKKDGQALQAVLRRFQAIGASEELLRELETKLSTSTDRNLIVSRGEYYAARVVAEKTGYTLVDAARLFRFNHEGSLAFAATSRLVKKLLANNDRPVVIPGFYGSDGRGRIHLFGRGGSDRTGALLASILGYDYENWTDVDGIYSADPRIVGPKIVPIPEITIEEIREGANGGAAVLMGDTIFDLHKSAVATTIKNTFDPAVAGTRVLQTRTSKPDQPVVGVAGHDDLLKLEIRRFGLNKIPGYIHQLLAYFSADTMPLNQRISIEYLPMGIDALSVAVRTSHLTVQRLERLHSLPRLIAADAQLKPDNALVWKETATVYLVGQELLNKRVRTHVHHRATGALMTHNLYFEDDVSDASSPSIAFLLDRKSMKPAIKALHAEFF